MGSKQKQLVNLELHSDVCLPLLSDDGVCMVRQLLHDDREGEAGRMAGQQEDVRAATAREQGCFSR